jgi:hypothetical protein
MDLNEKQHHQQQQQQNQNHQDITTTTTTTTMRELKTIIMSKSVKKFVKLFESVKESWLPIALGQSLSHSHVSMQITLLPPQPSNTHTLLLPLFFSPSL